MSSDIESAAEPDSHDIVDIADSAAVQRWSRVLGLTDEALRAAVQAVGPRVDRVKNYLGSGGMAGDQEDA